MEWNTQPYGSGRGRAGGRGRGGTGPQKPVAPIRRVWTRDSATDTPAQQSQPPASTSGVWNGAKRPREEQGAAAPAPNPAKRAAPSPQVAAEIKARSQEAEELRKKIADAEAKRIRDKKAADEAAVAAAAAAARAAAEADKQLRARRLAAGFATAVQRSAELRSAAGGDAIDATDPAEAQRLAMAEEEREVSRVLNADSDAAALGLPGAFATEDAIRRSFRNLARRIHPDKCKAPRAHDAFHRAKTAYAALLAAKGGS